MKNARILLLLVSASGLLLTACVSQAPAPQVASTPVASSAAFTVSATRDRSTRRVEKDGVVYFCERPARTGSHFISKREECYTEAQLRALRERDQDFVHRQQSVALQTNTTQVTKTPVSP
jgi:hypothetical protein